MAKISLLLLGVIFASGSCRIVSFHAPSPIQPKFIENPIFSAQHLYPVIAQEPAPVHEEQNEPPPPDSRRGSRPGFFSNGNSPLQVLNNVIPNAPPRVVPPPMPEGGDLQVTQVQPFSIDPLTGEPLKQSSPNFRELLNPRAPPVNVQNPLNIQFGRGFGGAPILDVSGGSPPPPPPQPRPETGFPSFDDFNFGSGSSSSQNNNALSFGSPRGSSGFRAPKPISGGFRPQASLPPELQSISSSSQSFSGSGVISATIFH